MAEFKVRADVTVSVEMDIVAFDMDAAERLFKDNMSMTANLIDTSTTDFIVCEECIEEIGCLEIEELK